MDIKQINLKQKTALVAKEFKKQLITLLLGSFGLVAALAWNDSIKSIIDSLFPVGTGVIWAKLIYAVVVTLLLVIVTLIFLKPKPEEVVSDKV